MQQKPIFNKRLYKAHAGITISKQASDILSRTPSQSRSEIDLRAIRSVVAGLREIHKNLEFVKTALGHAVTYEKHDSDVRVEAKRNETQMSCYYILSGSVEVFYTVRNSRTPFRESEERTISYANVAGDYVGLLSADGPNFDLPPPESMNTMGNCEFLRIDRAVFHEKIQEAQKLFQDEIVRFLDGNALFGKITEEDRLKLVSQMVKQVGKVLEEGPVWSLTCHH
jgi:DNA-dependent RNA polymerase auxiliary subunit epsilon